MIGWDIMGYTHGYHGLHSWTKQNWDETCVSNTSKKSWIFIMSHVKKYNFGFEIVVF